MKKILSNKTGFTLAEVIVAFAIFSIMAAMIMMILRLAIASRESNNTYAKELAMEQEKLVREPRELTYDETGLTGEFSFAFDGIAPIVYQYEVHAADPDAEYVEEGINYFVSKEVANYAAGGDGGGFTPPAGDEGGTPGGSQASQYDTRITGSKYFNYIDIEKCEKYTGPNQPATGVRYIMTFSAEAGAEMLTELTEIYAQYKVYFRDDSTTYTGTVVIDGTSYTRTYPSTPTVLEVGYAESSGGDYAFSTKRSPNNRYSNPYQVKVLRNAGVQIGIDYVNSQNSWSDIGQKSAKSFAHGGSTTIYVDFATDPQLTTASFGAVSSPDGYGGYKYQIYDNQPNIYGAFEYVDVEN